MFPKLAGQGEAYLVKQLIEFKSGVRNNAVMASMVASLNEQDMADLAAYFSSNKITPGAVSEDLAATGQQIFSGGNKKSGLPACMACHGPAGAGVPAAKWPALSGQHSAYVEAQLKSFAAGTRSNDPNSMMRDIASKMTADEMKAAAAYVAGLH
jgi:cytochrome c553